MCTFRVDIHWERSRKWNIVIFNASPPHLDISHSSSVAHDLAHVYLSCWYTLGEVQKMKHRDLQRISTLPRYLSFFIRSSWLSSCIPFCCVDIYWERSRKWLTLIFNASPPHLNISYSSWFSLVHVCCSFLQLYSLLYVDHCWFGLIIARKNWVGAENRMWWVEIKGKWKINL